MVTPTQRTTALKWAVNVKGLSRRGASRALGFDRSALRERKTATKVEAPDEKRLRELATEHPRWGCPLLHRKLRLEGFAINHKRTERLYNAMDLTMRCKPRRRLQRPGETLQPATAPNVCWSLDFMSDALTSRQALRWLNVVDDFSRQALCVRAAFSFPASAVVRVLEELIDEYGKPGRIRSDNGPEFIAASLQEWAREQQIQWLFIKPGKPAQNAYAERFNGTFRTEILDQNAFTDIEEAQHVADHWRVVYNEQRPHQALGHLPPVLFRSNWQASKSLL